MNIIYKKRFNKDFRKLRAHQQKAVKDTLAIFRKNPFDPVLDNHPLQGSLAGKRAIHAAFNLCIVFREEKNYTVIIMLRVGSHDKVYQ